MPHPIANLDDVPFQDFPLPAPNPRFACRMAYVGEKVGAQKLGYNVTAVPPGKAAFPFHSHRVNEEMFFVLSGSGEVRIGSETYPLRTGDVLACPPGGPETAHQIVNTSPDTELRYLAVSTRLSPELCEYPDSGKFGFVLRQPPDADGKTAEVFRYMGRSETSLPYWDGE